MPAKSKLTSDLEAAVLDSDDCIARKGDPKQPKLKWSSRIFCRCPPAANIPQTKPQAKSQHSYWQVRIVNLFRHFRCFNKWLRVLDTLGGSSAFQTLITKKQQHSWNTMLNPVAATNTTALYRPAPHPTSPAPLASLAGCLLFPLANLTLFHCYLIATNTTTNEVGPSQCELGIRVGDTRAPSNDSFFGSFYAVNVVAGVLVAACCELL